MKANNIVKGRSMRKADCLAIFFGMSECGCSQCEGMLQTEKAKWKEKLRQVRLEKIQKEKKELEIREEKIKNAVDIFDPVHFPPSRKFDLNEFLEETIYDYSNGKYAREDYFLSFHKLKKEDQIYFIENIMDLEDYPNYYASQFIENPDALKDYFTNLILSYEPRCQELLDKKCNEMFNDHLRQTGQQFTYQWEI